MQALVGGQRVGDEPFEILCGDVGAGLELDGRHRHLAGPRVGHAEHGAVGHGGVAVQHGLDLGGGDLKAAHLDHLLAAVRQMDPALGLQPADVTSPVPAVGEGRRRGLVRQVAGHGRLAQDLDLAHAARWQDLPGVEVDDAQRHAGDGSPAESRRHLSGSPTGFAVITGTSLVP